MATNCEQQTVGRDKSETSCRHKRRLQPARTGGEAEVSGIEGKLNTGREA